MWTMNFETQVFTPQLKGKQRKEDHPQRVCSEEEDPSRQPSCWGPWGTLWGLNTELTHPRARSLRESPASFPPCPLVKNCCWAPVPALFCTSLKPLKCPQAETSRSWKQEILACTETLSITSRMTEEVTAKQQQHEPRALMHYGF